MMNTASAGWPADVRHPRRIGLPTGHPLVPYLFVLLLAFAIRAPTFGNPQLDFDEQLYLTVGDRLLNGHWPYVEMWDRKPIGLFLFYAAIRAIGGAGIVQYQVVATFCAGGTAALIVAIARRRASTAGAIIAAIAYLLLLNPLHGQGGQAPVIYNLFTAITAWASFRANDRSDARSTIALAMLSMASIGIAIQFKYTPFIEGGVFGLHFLLHLRKCEVTWARMIVIAGGMIAMALAPTVAAILVYAWAGHLDAFVQANFVSVFERLPFPPETHAKQMLAVLIFGAPLIVAATAGIIRWMHRRGDRRDAMLLGAWMAAAIAAFLMLGDFYDFYFITVMLPLSVAAAAALDGSRIGFALTIALPLWPAMWTPRILPDTRVSIAATDRLANAVRPFVHSRCLYVYDGPTILYLMTNACVPTRFLYPDHLNNPTEAPALGVDPVVEMRRLLATRPGAIVTASHPLIPRVSPATQAVLKEALRRDYVLSARIAAAHRTFYVWAARDLRPAAIRDPRAATPL